MRSRVVKLTLERILEVLLSHGVQPHKIEKIMMDLGVPQHHIERTLANIISSKKNVRDYNHAYLSRSQPRRISGFFEEDNGPART